MPAKRYKVTVRSVPGIYEQYNGNVNVWARDTDHAKEQAFRHLKRGAFPDRDKTMWKVEKVESLWID